MSGRDPSELVGPENVQVSLPVEKGNAEEEPHKEETDMLIEKEGLQTEQQATGSYLTFQESFYSLAYVSFLKMCSQAPYFVTHVRRRKIFTNTIIIFAMQAILSLLLAL